MKVALVRHGETLGESSIRLNGATDVALSPLGIRQMSRVGAALGAHPFAAVIASPLQRSSAGARIVRPDLPPRIVAAFREVHFGRWETLTWAEATALDPEIVASMHASRADFTYPDGESRAAFRARVAAAAWAELAGAPGDVVAVLHKGVIKTAIAALTGLSPEEAFALPCELGSLATLTGEGPRWRLEDVGVTAHLGEDRSPASG
jgi:broad specificity phosphatase PhoE